MTPVAPASDLRALLRAIRELSDSMALEVQIFGVKKSADTRKAQRFFSERRVRAHFVDLLDRPMAEGEIGRFAQRFGIEALVDRSSKTFSELGLQHSNVSAGRWMDKLLANPLLLRMPLVRRLGRPHDLTVGIEEETWRDWINIKT